MYDKTFLDRHYAKILSDNRQRLLRGGVCDHQLLHAGSDDRLSLVLLIRPTPEIIKNILPAVEKLRTVEPDMYFYPPQNFHITVLELLKGHSMVKACRIIWTHISPA